MSLRPFVAILPSQSPNCSKDLGEHCCEQYTRSCAAFSVQDTQPHTTAVREANNTSLFFPLGGRCVR